MKKLLVLTDFTSNSAHAATIAVGICNRLGTDLLLYHSIQYVPLVTDYTYGTYITGTANTLFKESREKLTQEAESLQPMALRNNVYHPIIRCESGEGNLGANVKKITKKMDIIMVVMGGRSGGALDHLLTGSETTAVIKNAMKPVLVIPEKADLNSINRVIFATDFGTADIAALKYLTEIATPLGFEIEVVHVERPHTTSTGIEREVTFREYLNELGSEKISYGSIIGKHAVPRLQDYCKETSSVILAMTHGSQGFISRLFDHSETKEVIAHQQVAVIIFPPAFTDHITYNGRL